jgi:hypothetical protein
VCDLWNVSRAVGVPWLLVKSTEGIFSGIPGDAQKQASAEAAGVRRKSNGDTPYPTKEYIIYIPVCQEKRKCAFLFFLTIEESF